MDTYVSIFCDLSTWLMELCRYRKDITLSIETLEILIKKMSGK